MIAVFNPANDPDFKFGSTQPNWFASFFYKTLPCGHDLPDTEVDSINEMYSSFQCNECGKKMDLSTNRIWLNQEQADRFRVRFPNTNLYNI